MALTAALVLVGLAIGAAAAFLLRPQPEPAEAETYTTLSSRRGTVTNARFTGADAAIYSASWVGGPLRLYPASPGARVSPNDHNVCACLNSVSSSVTYIPPSPEQRLLFWLKLNAPQSPIVPTLRP